MTTTLQRLATIIFPLGSGAPDGPLNNVAVRYLPSLPVVVCFGLIASLLEGVGIGLVVPLLATVMSGSVPSSAPGPLQAALRYAISFEPNERLIAITGTLLVLIAIKAVVMMVNSVFAAAIEGRIGDEIRTTVCYRLLYTRYDFFLTHDASRLVNVISSDSWRVTDAVRHIFTIASASAAVAVFSVLLVCVEWRLFTIVLVGALILRGGQLLYSRRLRRMSEAVSTANRDLAERMLLVVTAVRLVQLFGQEQREQARFATTSERVRHAMFQVQRAASRVLPLFEFAQSALVLMVLLIAYGMGLSLPVMAAFLILMYRMQPHISALSQARLGLASLGGSIAEVEWLLDRSSAPSITGGASPGFVTTQPINFEDVSYAYPGRSDGQAAICAASFVIEPGRSTALIGRSGSGKSTIINLLCGLIEPVSGRISVGGIGLSELDRSDWRQSIALAGQDIDLVDGTIGDNIAYGRPDATAGEIEEAGRQADAHGFIASLPQGYATRVGLRGLSLSGGQRQRIGLARALIRDPALLILDEATNAVDGISEEVIMDLLREIRRDRTTIVISHRRSTLAACEVGVVMANGRVVESGPLRSLAFYRDMEALEPLQNIQSA